MESRDDAYALLEELDAPAHLIQHAQLVWEAGAMLVETFRAMNLALDYRKIEVGIAIHDIGKVVHKSELSVSGSDHESSGQRLLLERGVDPALARICVSHGQWNTMECSLEELIVALADKLWKGKRVEELELRVIDTIAALKGDDRWTIYASLDDCFEAIASTGHERLQRSTAFVDDMTY